MQQFNFETIKEALNPAKFIDQAEKNTHRLFYPMYNQKNSATLWLH